MNILVVDDSKVVCSHVGQMLSDAGHAVETALNGQLAIDLLNQGASFDAILLDWNMPVMDGPSFLKELQKDGSINVPVIMMTTENHPDKIRTALSLGACEYIMKPFTSDILIEKLNDFAEAS